MNLCLLCAQSKFVYRIQESLPPDKIQLFLLNTAEFNLEECAKKEWTVWVELLERLINKKVSENKIKSKRYMSHIFIIPSLAPDIKTLSLKELNCKLLIVFKSGQD